MGHYYSEMCCQKCGKMHCVCPETLERERKWAQVSWEEVQKEKMKTLLEAIRKNGKKGKERGKINVNRT